MKRLDTVRLWCDYGTGAVRQESEKLLHLYMIKEWIYYDALKSKKLFCNMFDFNIFELNNARYDTHIDMGRKE